MTTVGRNRSSEGKICEPSSPSDLELSCILGSELSERQADRADGLLRFRFANGNKNSLEPDRSGQASALS
jgi:hypothetical protein